MSDINATLDRYGIKRCGDSSCIFGPCGGMMTNGGCRCGHEDPGAPSRPTRLSRQLAHAVTDQAAEIARLTAELSAAREAAQRDRDVAQAMAKAAHEAEEQLAAARAVPADVEAATNIIDNLIARCDSADEVVTGESQSGMRYRQRVIDAASMREDLVEARTAIARAIATAEQRAVCDFIDRHAKRLCEQAGHAWNRDDEEAEEWASDVHDVLNHLRADETGHVHDGRKATTPPPTVGGLLAAGEERESRAWSEKGKAPPGSCPFCASRISMVQRDGYFIARCSHRGCGAVGPRMRSVSRAADLFCQPPRREAQGMSCGPIVASPPRPRCSCTHEAGDSRCDAHPTCSECGASTTRPVDGCAACRGPLPKGG